MASIDEDSHYDIDALMALEYGPPEVDEQWNEVPPDEPMDLPNANANLQLQPHPVDAIYEEPVHAMAIEVVPPLDVMEISSSSSHSSQVNWYDYIDYMSESDGSSATDMSTANSFNIPVNGHRYNQLRKKKVVHKDEKERVSSTASNYFGAKCWWWTSFGNKYVQLLR